MTINVSPKLSEAETQAIETLIDAGRRCVSQGLTLASGGNLSARVQGSDRFFVTGSGEWLDELTFDSFAVMSLDGEQLNDGVRPSSEWKLHQRTYAVRADVGGIVHVHPQHAVLLDALKKPIRFLTLDHAYYVGSAGRVPYLPNGSDELADQVAEQSIKHNAVILGNHGSSTVGDDVRMAFRRAMLLEEAATMTYRTLLLGDEETDFPEEGRPTLAHA